MPRESNEYSDSPDSSRVSGPSGAVNRRRFMAAVSAGVPVALAGCTGGSDDEEPTDAADDSPADNDNSGSDSDTATPETKMGGELTWGGSVPVQSLDPHLESAAATQRVLTNITEGLVRLDWDYSIIPHLASSFETSEDNTTLSFELQEGVSFHDGSEMTSADVLASFERVANGEYLATGFFDFVDSLDAPGDYSFEINLTQPFAPFLARMATSELHVVPEEQAAQDQIEEPIGTGPFQFESMEIEEEFVMTRFEDYWREDLPYLDRVVKKEIPDPSVRLQSFRAGEFDFINDVPAKDVDSIQNDDSVRYESLFPKSLIYLGMNCDQEPFDDKNARLALDFALDFEEITEAATYGHGRPTASPAAPGSPWVHPDIEPRPRDLDAAAEHLEQSAYPDGFEASFKIPQSYTDQVTAAEVIADQASEVGIDLQIQQITWSTWLSDVYTDRNFQATTSSYLALYYPDVSFYKFLHPNGAFFFTGWENEEYNELVEEARTLYDPEERTPLYHEATEILQEDRAGHMLLYWRGNHYASSPDYKGEIGAPDGSVFRFEDNWLDR